MPTDHPGSRRACTRPARRRADLRWRHGATVQQAVPALAEITPAFVAWLDHPLPDCTRIRFAGELDVNDVGQARTAIAAARATDAHLIAIDLQELTFTDASGIEVLVEAWQWATDHDRRLVLVGAHGSVARVLVLLGISGRFTMVGDLSALTPGPERAPATLPRRSSGPDSITP